MEKVMVIPDYNPSEGIRLVWEPYHEIKCTKSKTGSAPLIISANEAGLITLANFLLTLAQKNVPSGSHLHLDEYGGLEPGSCELILEKT